MGAVRTSRVLLDERSRSTLRVFDVAQGKQHFDGEDVSFLRKAAIGELQPQLVEQRLCADRVALPKLRASLREKSAFGAERVGRLLTRSRRWLQRRHRRSLDESLDGRSLGQRHRLAWDGYARRLHLALRRLGSGGRFGAHDFGPAVMRDDEARCACGCPDDNHGRRELGDRHP